MKILNLRKKEKNTAILWDGKDDTLNYLNSEEFLLSITFKDLNLEETNGSYTIAKFEKIKTDDLLLTTQFYYDLTETHSKLFKIGEYVILQNEYPHFIKKNEDEIINSFEIINELEIDKPTLKIKLEDALENEDYMLAAKLRDKIKRPN